MSTPLLVKISRDGKEIGTYEAKEAIRLLGAGTLEPTDLYLHEGMTSWGLLSNLEQVRQVALDRVVKARLAGEEVDQEVGARLAQDEGRNVFGEKSTRWSDYSIGEITIGLAKAVLVTGLIFLVSALLMRIDAVDWLVSSFMILWGCVTILLGLIWIIKKLFNKK